MASTISEYVFPVPEYIPDTVSYCSLRYSQNHSLCQCLLLNLLCRVVRTWFERRLKPKSHTACGLPLSKFRREATAVLLLWLEPLIALSPFQIVWKPPGALSTGVLELLIGDLPWRRGKPVKRRQRLRMRMDPLE